MIPIIVFSLLFVLLIVFCVLSAKAWHWSNIVFLILCYLAGVAACVGAAQSLNLRFKALALVEKTELELNGSGIDTDGNGIDDAIDANIKGNGHDNDNDGISDSKARLALANQVQYFTYGSPNSLTYSPDSARGLNQRYVLATYGRGLVRQNLVVSQDGPNRVVQLAVQRPDDALTLIGSELYAFRDEDMGAKRRAPARGVPGEGSEGENTKKDGELKLPTRFIGSMRVIAESPESLTLEPAFIVSQRLYEEVREGVTWTLYQKMPSDRHDNFFGLVEGFDPTSDELENSQITEYREKLEALMPPARMGFDVTSGDNEIARNAAINYERFIDQICFDGMSLARIGKWIDVEKGRRRSGEFVYAEEDLFVKYEFTADSDTIFQVNGDGKQNIQALGVGLENAYFPDGRVVDKSLYSEQEDVQFKKGDIVLIDNATAAGQQTADLKIQPFAERESISVKELDRIFVRGLLDFPRLIKDYQAQTGELAEASEKVRADMLISQKNQDSIQAQTGVQIETIAKLEEDEQNLRRDLETIKQLLATRQQELESLQSKIVRLEAEIRDKRAVSR